MLVANLTPFASVSDRVDVVSVVSDSIDPLSPIAQAINVLDNGDAIRALTENEPADSPAMVTRCGSPPNAAMFVRTHGNDAA